MANDDDKIKNEFNSFLEKDFTDEDVNRVFSNEESINKKGNKGPLKKFAGDIKLFFCMLKDYFSKKYTNVPKRTIAAIIFTLLYVFSPIDIVPDVIPVLGLVDDAAIVGLCLKLMSGDLNEYKKYLATKEAVRKDLL